MKHRKMGSRRKGTEWERKEEKQNRNKGKVINMVSEEKFNKRGRRMRKREQEKEKALSRKKSSEKPE